MHIKCEVIAPSMIPQKPGERIKTDRRDAINLAKLLRAEELTPIYVPLYENEALRDLVRAREDAKEDELRAKHCLIKFLLHHDIRAPIGVRKWTAKKYRDWLNKLKFDHVALFFLFGTLLIWVQRLQHLIGSSPFFRSTY